MPYKTLMIHLGVGRPNTEVLRVAGELSNTLGARLVGVAACQPMEMVYADGYTGGAALADCQDELISELRDAEAEFREALKSSKASLEWRSDYTTEGLPYYLASEARCADLILTSAASADPFDSSRHASVGELVMRAGRPVLVVPQAGAKVPLEKIVIAWKDTREARRAAVDALPLLALAKQVTVVEVAEKADVPTALRRAEDVVQWLAAQGVTAAPIAVASHGSDADSLEVLLKEQDCDLVVAGAYGHSRLREWAFGGVTHSLLQAERCALLSH